MANIINIVEIADVAELVSEEDAGNPLVEREQARVLSIVNDLKRVPTVELIEQLIPFLAKDKNRKVVRVEGGLQALIDILATINSAKLLPIHKAALLSLTWCSKNLPSRDDIRRKGGIAHLANVVKYLSASSPADSEGELVNALTSLKELAEYDKNRAAIREAAVIDLVIQKILPSNIALEISLDLLTALSTNPSDEQSHLAIGNANGIPLIVQLILTDSLPIRRSAIRCIAAIAPNSRSIQRQIRTSKGALEAVCGLLADPIEDNRRIACLAISSFSENDFTNQTTLLNAGVVDYITQILQSNDSNDTKKEACAAIRSLSRGNKKLQSTFCERSYLPILVNLVATTNAVGVKVQAIHSVNELARDNPTNCDIICASGMVKALVDALQPDQHHLIHYASAGAIHSLCLKAPKRASFFIQEGAKPLLEHLKQNGNDAKVKKGASWALETFR